MRTLYYLHYVPRFTMGFMRRFTVDFSTGILVIRLLFLTITLVYK